MNYADLIQAIQAQIRDNTTQAITGQILQDILVEMVQELGQAGAVFGGVVDRDFVPATTDSNIFYVASVPGTYSGFGQSVSVGEFAIFYFDGSDWAKATVTSAEVEVTPGSENGITLATINVGGQNYLIKAEVKDSTPTPNSTHPVESGGVYDALQTIATQISAKADKTYVDNQLALKVNTADIVDNLTSEQSTKPLSANQGRLLDNKINTELGVLDNDQIDITSIANSGFISVDGVVTGNADYRYTNPIPCSKGDVIYAKLVIGTSAAAIALCDAGGTDYTCVVPGLTSLNYGLYRYLVEEDGYFCVSYSKNWSGNTVYLSSSLVSQAAVDKDTYTAASPYPFAVADENANMIVAFENGHIRTKNFYSGDIPSAALAQFNRYKGKKFSLLGDSISTFGDPDSRNENGTYCYSYFPTETCRYSVDGTVTIEGVTYSSIQFDVQDTYWMRLINALGMKLGVNESWRGTSVSGSGSSAFNNQTRIDHLGSNGTPDVILVYGGTNDAGGGVTIGTFDTTNPQNYTDAQIAALPVTTFADAYRTMLIRLMHTYPLAEIIVVLPTFTTSYYTIDNLDLYVEVIKEACDFFGIKYIDARCTGINVYNRATYLVDGIHPNTDGMRLLFEKIYRQILFT